MKIMTIKRVLYGIAVLPGSIILYLIVSWIGGVIPVNSDFDQTQGGVEIYVKSNGVHTDIVVPVVTEVIDWKTRIRIVDFVDNGKPFEYVALGWGDKGFYLDTPTWADLKASTAFKAAFGLGASAMHVTYYDFQPTENKDIRKVQISYEQYNDLVKYIDRSFEKDKDGKYILIGCCHYNGLNDNFYEAEGRYSIFRTCNGWTNNGIKIAGIKTALWAPLEWAIMYHLI